MPLISIFTPTHDSKYLLDAYRSLQRQDFQNFEWIIVPNAAEHGDMPVVLEEIRRDPRVRIRPCTRSKKSSIGALKRYACGCCRGDILVELDHDDMLAPGILSRIVDAFNRGADFVYSDVALFNQEDDTPTLFDERHGWETYPAWLYGQECVAHRAFEVTPRSLASIYYTPDHVRCWRTTFYDKIGGHDPKLAIGDDHDLICRSYLHGGIFQHIPTCGYFYRCHGDGTTRKVLEQIDKQQKRNCAKYLHSMIDMWLYDNDLELTDLNNKDFWDPAAIRIDAPDNSVGCIKAYGDVLPMVPREMITPFMEELYRVLAPGGYACIAYPHLFGEGAHAPHFKSFWSEGLLSYYTDMDQAMRLPSIPKAKFQIIQTQTLNRRPDKPHLHDIWSYVDLVALKGQKMPGLQLI